MHYKHTALQFTVQLAQQFLTEAWRGTLSSKCNRDVMDKI